MKKPEVIEVYADNGQLSHYALVNTETGNKLWSEAPEECKAMGHPVVNNDFIHSVSERNIAIGDYVWYNERIHKVQKIRFDDEFWQGKEIAIIDIQAKDTKDVPTRVLRYVR